ncbi:MAG: hypothetical protein V7638_4495, partial [Acidobacteriota bacterium]
MRLTGRYGARFCLFASEPVLRYKTENKISYEYQNPEANTLFCCSCCVSGSGWVSTRPGLDTL